MPSFASFSATFLATPLRSVIGTRSNCCKSLALNHCEFIHILTENKRKAILGRNAIKVQEGKGYALLNWLPNRFVLYRYIKNTDILSFHLLHIKLVLVR